MNKYDLNQLNNIDELDGYDDVNRLNKVDKLSRPGSAGKKMIMVLLLVLAIATPVVYYLFSDTNVKAEAEKEDKTLVDSMLNELQKEQALMEHERQKLLEQQRNLKNFESELDKRYSEYLQREQQLAAKEADFNNKVGMRMVDRQTIETYESIDPEQAAVLLKNMYEKDPELATLIMKRIPGKKAGRILEAMIPIDREVSTKIAQDALNYYRIK
ncbi:MAG: hypothetical protein QG657_1738 [Acidobacteriota bacterium]|nr:hypothetical protein [Acidobacteriota bacterium]